MEEMTLQKEAVKTPSKQKTTYVVRDIFHLKFGHFKDAKKLLEEAKGKNMLPPDAQNVRLLTDFTGDSYRLIMESGYDTLGNYENSLSGGMGQPEWQDWYERFKTHVETGHREILKQLV